ncbi:MAG: PEP-CTERM sorting domain-containing protein [Deltaproteobacteria bacterium]|nr:MAG: PEP-CTERM sorting domain-containing protein [Deltaproteobacteria bacterium]
MLKRRTDSNGRTSRRRDLAAWLMLLLPGFMFLGLLAPAAITVKPVKVEETAASETISFRNFAPRRPLQFPLAIAHAVLADTNVDPVFAGARYLANETRGVLDVKTDKAEVKTDDQIVLAEDSVQSYVAETLFDQSTDQTQLVVDLTPLWDPAVFDIIPGLINRMGYQQWDDFHGTSLRVPRGTAPAQTPPVPEPATGALVALGLAALAVRRRA